MYFISVSTGLLTAEHMRRMRVSQKTSAIWLYMWFLDKMTSIDEQTHLGVVLGGKPIKLEEVPFGDLKTVRKMFHTLQREGYIMTVRTPYGHQVWITKAKKRFGLKIPDAKSGRSLSKSGRSDDQNLVGLVSKSGRSNKTIQLNNNSKTLLRREASSKKTMNKNRMGSYREDSPSDSFEAVVDLDTGEVRAEKKVPRPTFELIAWAEKRTGKKYVNAGKQAKAVARMFDAGYTAEQIRGCWERLEKDTFWADKGFDFGVVSIEISKATSVIPHVLDLRTKKD